MQKYTLLVLVLSGLLFLYIVLNVHTDIQSHIYILIEALKKENFPVPPLYYLFLYLLSGFSFNLKMMKIAAIVILSLAVTFKYTISTKLYDLYESNKGHFCFYLFCLIIAMPVFYSSDLENHFMLGKLNVNVWHNSTVIFLMPFAVYLFYASYQFATSKTIKTEVVYTLFVLVILNALSKPSFLFSFCPVFPLFVIINKPTKKKLLLTLLISATGLIVIFGEYVFIFVERVSYDETVKNNIEIMPFGVLKLYSKNLTLDFIASLLFPIAFLCLFFKRAVQNSVFQYVIMLYLTALLIGVTFVETGDRFEHANLMWQIPVVGYLLFLVCLILGLHYLKNKSWRYYKSIIFFSAFILHTISGFLYIYRIIIHHTWN